MTAKASHAGKVILALDVDCFEEARHFVNALYPKVKIFKVGSQLFIACGPKVVDWVQQKGAEVFLDLKFLDIPNTVANAVRSAVRLRVKMLTLHISGGYDMLNAAVEAARQEAGRIGVKRPLLIGVTVLTSQESTFSRVFKLARLGIDSGLDGIVCSVREAALLKGRIKEKFFAVTPGIRIAGARACDQRRVATACEAIKGGSDFLVVGRPVLSAEDPVAAVEGLFLNSGAVKKTSRQAE